MRITFAFALLCLAIFDPAVAQQVEIDSRDCRRLLARAPDTDARYRPGVDARGRPVAPADLGGGSPVILPDTIEAPVTVDLAERHGIDIRGLDAEAVLGRIVLRDGRAYWNGRLMTPEDTEAILRHCR